MDHKHKKEIDNWTQQQTLLFNPAPTPQTLNEEYCHPFTQAYLANALKTVNYKSAPGEDTIPYRAMKELPEEAKAQLLNIYNTCLARGYFPKDWKTATGKMIKKPNKPKDDPGSYRPIGLLNCLSKTLEKLITTRIHSFIQDNKERSQRTHLHPRKLHKCSQNQEKISSPTSDRCGESLRRSVAQRPEDEIT